MLLDALVAALPASALEETRSSARAELRVLATRMSVEAYRDAETRLVRHLIRTQLGLPQIASHV